MSDNGNTGQPERKPHPNRVAGMRKVNEILRQRREAGSLWPGGHPVDHGLRKLEGMLARGRELPGGLGELFTVLEGEYVGILEAEEQPDPILRGIVKRLVRCDLNLALLDNQRLGAHGQLKRLPPAKAKELAMQDERNAAMFTTLAIAFHARREKLAARREVDATKGSIVIQQYADSPPAPQGQP